MNPYKRIEQTKILFLFTALLFYVALTLVNGFVKIHFKDRPLYFAPPQAIKYFSFGFSEVYGDLLWLRLIQDMDFCSSEKGKPVYTGDIKYQCRKGWSYRMTDALTELTPRFLPPYLTASSIMSVIMGDKEGAKRIYDKGVKRFPENWNLYFHAGYHYIWELKDDKGGTELLLQAARNGGPQWLYGLVAKKYKKFGKLLLARQVLKEFLKKDTLGEYQKVIKKRLMEIEKELKKLDSNLSDNQV